MVSLSRFFIGAWVIVGGTMGFFIARKDPYEKRMNTVYTGVGAMMFPPFWTMIPGYYLSESLDKLLYKYSSHHKSLADKWKEKYGRQVY